MTKITLHTKFLFFAIASIFLLISVSSAQQIVDSSRRNSPFAKNPKSKSSRGSQPPAPDVKPIPKNDKAAEIQIPKEIAKADKPANNEAPQTEKNSQTDSKDATYQKAEFETHSIAKKTYEVAKRATTTAVAPTQTYKVGVGDVLYISLQNSPAKESSYFTVLKDGTIDYPLAGGMISVLNLTTEDIQYALQEKIKLYENPQLLVNVREYNSHNFTVLGMVENPGVKSLQREAYPLNVIRSQFAVDQKSAYAVIKRVNSQTETVDLRDSKYEDVLIFPGDTVEFIGAQFYYIGGEINSGGRKDIDKDLTLMRAILACGGTKKPDVKKVVIRRKSVGGLLVSTTHDLKAINDGKKPDPLIEPGDIIEVGN